VLGPDHRIVTAAGNPITHHPDGPRATDTHQHYDIDALGRIVRVRDATTGAVTAEFTYDALSRAATGDLAGTAFKRSFLGTTLIQETRGAADEVRQATPHPLWAQPLSVSDSANTFFIHPDEGLSTLCVTDATGTVQERHRYGPFGAPRLYEGDGVTSLAPGDAASEPRWRGMPLINAIGLYASTQRLYDPDLGVFLDRDPRLYVDSPSLWVFAAGNPVDFADPQGSAKSPIGNTQIELRPDDLIRSRKYDQTLIYDLPPDETGYRGEDYFGYAFIYGLKQTVWNPTKSLILGQRPKYIDTHGNVKQVPWRPDRSAEMLVAIGTVALLFTPTPKTPRLEGGLTDALFGRSALGRAALGGDSPAILTNLENDIEVAASSPGRARLPTAPWKYGPVGPQALGETNAIGEITIKPGLTGQVLTETVRHETVHHWLSPLNGPLSRRLLRGNFGMWAYENSNLVRFVEEGLAESYGTLNPIKGFGFAYRHYNINPLLLALEGGIYSGVAVGAPYGLHQYLNDPKQAIRPQ
jgi:RHS repeat-associated protein